MNNILNELKQKIAAAKEAYYTTGTPLMSDRDYDLLVSQAEKLGYIETVGAAPTKNIPVIKHEHPMLSLDKVHTAKEVSEFMKDKDILIMNKEDGLSISVTYIDGVLTRLETRGNGEVGNDIMFHANSFVNLPKIIDKPGKYVIDGECVILRSDFDAINIKGEFSNPRNLASGSLNQLDPQISRQRHLRFFAWDVIDGGETNSSFKNLNAAKDLGFDIVQCLLTNDSDPEHLDWIFNNFREKAQKDGQPIDGIVIRFDDIKYGKSLGMTGHHPRHSVAFKFFDESVATKLVRVEYQVGKTGQITPIAIFNPVNISDTIVEKASLHNVTIMKRLGLTNGCTVNVVKANDIIPQIESAEFDGDGEVEIPSICPICGHPTKIVKENDSEVLYCTNDACPGKLAGLWKTFVSKQGLDVDGLSEETLKKFLKLGYLTDKFTSLFELDQYRKELYQLDGFGKKSIDNLLSAIEASKDIDLINFITSFSIPGIGKGQAKLLTKKFKTFESFADACNKNYDFTQIDGIGPVLRRSIHNWWVSNQKIMEDVAEICRFKSDDFMNPPTGNYPLAGLTFVITGKVNKFANRDAVKDKIESLGGAVAGSVSKKTNYLINNDVTSSSGKNKKAQELNVPIISENDFLKMIGE